MGGSRVGVACRHQVHDRVDTGCDGAFGAARMRQ